MAVPDPDRPTALVARTPSARPELALTTPIIGRDTSGTSAPKLTGMDTSPGDEAFDRWRTAMLDSLASPERVLAWQDRRYWFAHQVGQLLTSPALPDAAPVTGHVVYGVY